MSEKKTKTRGLGRGLSALMADASVNKKQEKQDVSVFSVEQTVPIEKIFANPDQPRRTFEPEQLNDLANSVRAKGVIQPLIVRDRPDHPGEFEIVAGERRWRAAQMAQQHELPVIHRAFSDTEVLEVAIIENIQRADLNPVEEAFGYRQLMDKFGHTQEQMAEALGKSRSHIANLLRLLSLPPDVQEFLREGRLSAGHARALVTAENPTVLAGIVIAKGLSVRETEKLVKKAAKKDTGEDSAPKRGSSPGAKDADTKALEGDLSAALGLKVVIDHKPGGEAGQMSLQYTSLEQLDDLCRMLSTPG
ncbi:ParB/RepB/Spo0J family partition protein [Rhodobacteraceae bacterium nBUS_22]